VVGLLLWTPVREAYARDSDVAPTGTD
jgi:hypothetical protein